MTGETPESVRLSRSSFSASSSVSRLKVPAPRLTPPWLLEPGVMTMRLVPRLLICSLRLRALADGHHHDDRTDADDDAEHRQQRPHLVLDDALRG